jgi:amino acid adenylation domain-containing protein
MSGRQISQSTTPLASWTTSQRELWSLHMLEANGAALNLGRVTELVGALDVQAFVRASTQTIEECEALRLCIDEQDGHPTQRISLFADWSPAVLDFSHEKDPSQAARDWMTAEVTRNFDITKCGFSWTLIRVAETRHIWCLIVHHLVADGLALNLVACRMADNYSRLIDDVEATTKVPDPLSDLLQQDAAYRQSEDFKSDRAYWLGQMANPQLPTRLTSRTSSGSYMAVRYTDRMSASASGSIRKIMADTGVSLSGLFVGLAALYLRRLTGASDIAVGLLVAARTTPAARNTLGVVSNTVPIRLKINADTTLTDLIAQVRARIREALKHQRLPLSDLKASLTNLTTELYAIAVNVMKFDVAPRFGDLVSKMQVLSNGPVDDISIDVFEQPRDGSLEIALYGNVNRYETAQLSEHYKFLMSCLEQLCRTGPATPVDSIDWISEADRASLVDSGAAPDAQQPANAGESEGADEPNSEREVQVCNAFARAFGIESFPVRGNFFREGGYSLLAARLISDLAIELDAKIPLRALFEHPTPRALTRYLSAPMTGAAQKSDLPLLVLFPNGGALMREMIDLRGALQADFSVLFIEYPNSRRDWDVICDVDRYLDFILAQIRAVAPEARPLTLVGYSLGASIAYAMHFILLRLGYTIERFNAIDGRSPVDRTAEGRARRLASDVVSASSKADVILRVSASAARALGRFFGAHAKKPAMKAVLRSLRPMMPDDEKNDFLFHMAAVLNSAIPMQAIRGWTAAIAPEDRPVGAPVTLFRSTDNGDNWAYDLGWTELAPNLEIVPLHSSHTTIVNKYNVAVISSRIRRGSVKSAAAAIGSLSDILAPLDVLAPSGDRTRQGPALCGRPMPELLRDEILSEIFAAVVARTPNAVCMTTKDSRLSYAEVDRRAAAIARGLVQRGVKAGETVGLWLERGTDLLISQIAIAKTGAAWLPFDSEAPVQRVAACLSDAGACLLLADAARARRVTGILQCPTIDPGGIVDLADQSSVDARALGATPDHAAYMIYTSGSTGEPKGIIVSNRNICHFLRSVNEVYRITGDDVMFQNASMAFDLSLEQIWLSYMVGAALFVADVDTVYEIDELPRRLEHAGVTVLDTVPTLLGMLPRDVETLRIIILGGEACAPVIVEHWAREGRALYNTYGPTEATVVATAAQLRRGENVTIGRPIPNYSCYVVDADLVPVDVGVEGELLVGGPGVSRGYLGDADLTARKFIANPFKSDGSDPILYRTGDAVVIDNSGRLVFKGRIDDQIKIRGFRVELGEIDARLSDIPGVSVAATVLVNDEGDDRLIAYLVTETEMNAAHLRESLLKYLPSHMVPMRFERVRALPRLPSGKVDRMALRKLGAKPLVIPHVPGKDHLFRK